MKRSVITALFVFIALASFAQSISPLLATRSDRFSLPNSVWYHYDSNLYQYNALDQDTTQNIYYYSQNTWKLRAQIFQVFTPAGQLDHQLIAYNDTLTGASGPNFQRIIFSYNAVGDTIFTFVQRWDIASSSWTNVVRIYAYPDINHRDTALESQRYNAGNWENDTYLRITYNSNGSQSSRTTLDWTSGAYVYTDRQRFSYDVNGNLATNLSQVWNTSTSSWDNSRRFTYTYNSSNDNTQRAHELWNTATSAWDNDSLVWQTFSGTHKIINQQTQTYNTASQAYVNRGQSTYTYDANDNITQTEQDDWYQSQWTHEDRYTNQYNSDNQITYQLHEEYNFSGTIYEYYERKYFYYRDASTGVNDIQAMQSATVYPNPAIGNEVHVAFQNVQGGNVIVNVYDIQGRSIIVEQREATAGNNDIKIDLSPLATGAYTVALSTTAGTKLVTAKMIKQ